MALTTIQRDICRLISKNRIQVGESYVAGGVALNTLINAPRVSRDIDLFHDSRDAVYTAWEADRTVLEEYKYTVTIVRERSSYVEAIVGRGQERVLMQWTSDSAFRFFPLMEHDELGLTLHPFDLATNKALALVGRLEVRDWIDLIQCHSRIQNTGYLMWAACGKDPGFNPALILAEARRSSHYTQADVAELAFHGDPPDLRKLSVEWKRMLLEAEDFFELLPPERIGACVLDADGHLFKGDPASLRNAIEKKTIRFHSGTLRGAFPSFSV